MPNTPTGRAYTATDKARDALAGWYALGAERQRVQDLMAQAEQTCDYSTADTASFDLHEHESESGYEAVTRLRELVAHHEALLRRLSGLARDAAAYAEDAPPVSPAHDLAATLATITGGTYQPDFADWDEDELAAWEAKHGPITWSEGTLACGACGRDF